ncbi:hypothetical protein D1007_52555 [Hordeum vulgare]|nr:hypothetical protein D1007_52555 [Hordeum vulgare]
MEAARKAVSGYVVVGRLLSPFHVNPHAIVDELRAIAWKNQGVVTVEEVASDDGRFILNFVAEGDRRFVLKAQPWHYRRDGVIFAEFDGKGDPAGVDLGVMAIWAQVRDLPFELKTESMGWTLGDQLGEVLEVSHRNHIIVQNILRVHVEIMLHEPLKIYVGLTPLGSSKQVKFDVHYEKLPLYCECCGLVRHTSESFCNIPSKKRVASYPKNLSVEAYWKGQGASKRALKFGSFSCAEKLPNAGISSNNTDGTVVKVATSVSGLSVAEKDAATLAKMAASTTVAANASAMATFAAAAEEGTVQATPMLGQDGRAWGGYRCLQMEWYLVRWTDRWCRLHLLDSARRSKAWWTRVSLVTRRTWESYSPYRFPRLLLSLANNFCSSRAFWRRCLVLCCATCFWWG